LCRSYITNLKFKCLRPTTNCDTTARLCSPTSPSRSVRSVADIVALRLLRCPDPVLATKDWIRSCPTTLPTHHQPLVEETHAILPRSLHSKRRPCRAEHPHVCAQSCQVLSRLSHKSGNRASKRNDPLPKCPETVRICFCSFVLLISLCQILASVHLRGRISDRT
jgi:hypothetical protein